MTSEMEQLLARHHDLVWRMRDAGITEGELTASLEMALEGWREACKRDE